MNTCVMLTSRSYSKYSKTLLTNIKDIINNNKLKLAIYSVDHMVFITKTRPCNILRFFKAVKMIIFR